MTQIKLNGKHIDDICNGLAKLMIVDISLERNQDNPQLIFESMNSTGKALSEADLIRNYILMGLEHELQTEIYQNLWRPMELDFGQEAYGDQFDDFMERQKSVKLFLKVFLSLAIMIFSALPRRPRKWRGLMKTSGALSLNTRTTHLPRCM
jgi:uncharacterized protein with ParB-like and HNH nuclease domain